MAQSTLRMESYRSQSWIHISWSKDWSYLLPTWVFLSI